MVLFAMLRHGDTDWSADGRIQGRSDPTLTDEARERLRRFKLPEVCARMRIVTSPLARCVETAALLGAPHAPREPRIAEMSWGGWEGRRLADLRAELGPRMSENEARGWDFRPDGGESPREVLKRVRAWLAGLTEPTLAVTHRGVIRPVYAQAAGWDMLGRPPVKLAWDAVHVFRLQESELSIESVNVR
ncbi:MAG: histidine phosphatase family protein [Betaproteobacteria bacterium]|nr:histidine phosphatase family protein [Betaproteobacteria bacterium]MBV9360338.1 histidine phosphatase family protein [Betaproteobacteria bacterium]